MRKIDVRKITISSMFCALLVISALISIPIPLLAIKITLQTMVIFIIGAILPPSYAIITVSLYTVLGLCGLPVFSSGSGPMYIFAPSFGFLLGFIISSPIMAKINGSSFRTPLVRYIISIVVALVIIYSIGIPYLYLILKVYMDKDIPFSYALVSNGLLFMPFDILKAIIAYPIITLLKKNLLKF
jgi:biotin transport system substrate-specific component